MAARGRVGDRVTAEPIETALAMLAERRRGALRRGSHRARALCEELGSPHLRQPVVHVAGTNGKTSVVRMIASLLAALDVRAGDTTSPHLDHLGERIRIDTAPAALDQLASPLQRLPAALRRAERRTGEPPTFFDAITALALRTFVDTDRELAVVEAGIGGSGDATDVVDGRVAVLTPIGLDHVELGTSYAEVATNKAGIVRPGGVVVTAVQHPAAARVIDRVAAAQGATLLRIGRDAQVIARRSRATGQAVELRGLGDTRFTVMVPLHGAAQAVNAAQALAAVQAALGTNDLDPRRVRAGFAAVRVPGRTEFVARPGSPTFVFDGAHDPSSSASLAATILERSTDGPVAVVVGTSGGRDPVPLIEPLADRLRDRLLAIVATSARAPSASPAAAVGARLRPLAAVTTEAERVPDALSRAAAAVGPDGLVVVTGSLYLAAEARSCLAGPSDGTSDAPAELGRVVAAPTVASGRASTGGTVGV